MDWLLYVIAGVAFLLALVISLKAGKGLRYVAVSSGCGVVFLLVATWLGSKIGLQMPMNPTNLLLSAGGGLPGFAFAVALRCII